jgi:hypothetical protein
VDIVGNSNEFTIKTGLLELLPDECMVGVECCYMNGSVDTGSSLQQISSEYFWTSDNDTALVPSPTIQKVQNMFEIRNNFFGINTIRTLGNYTNNIGIYLVTPTSILATKKYVWIWGGWKFDSIEYPRDEIPSSLVQFRIDDNTIFNITAVPGDIDGDNHYIIKSRHFLADGSQDIILFNEFGSFSTIQIGQLFMLKDAGNPYPLPYSRYTQILYTVQEIIDQNHIRFRLGFQNYYANGKLLEEDPNPDIGYFYFQFWNTIATSQDSTELGINPQTELSVSNGIWDQTGAPISLSDGQMNISSIVDIDSNMFFYNSVANTTGPSDILNINIESSLFTSARTYDTATTAYSSTIGSFPIDSNGKVSFREAVNNRNCSMFQINKNILNNFEIPFRITVGDGTQKYEVLNPDRFYIRFSLWFYEQTDDERYYNIPSL